VSAATCGCCQQLKPTGPKHVGSELFICADCERVATEFIAVQDELFGSVEDRARNQAPAHGPSAGSGAAGSVDQVSDEERYVFATPPMDGHLEEIDLAFLDPSDEDDRHFLILAEHPELQRAIRDEQKEIRLGNQIINPTLHITMHEIVANQLWANNPPEVWETAQRLVADGYERHEVLHMLCSVASGEVFDALKHEQPHDPDRMRAALDALPGSWEELRDRAPEERHENRAERRAAARIHRRGARG